MLNKHFGILWLEIYFEINLDHVKLLKGALYPNFLNFTINREKFCL